jgi:hypothetical protein
MPVHTEIADAMERLRAISADAQKSKRVTDAIGKELARDLLNHLPNVVADAVIRNVKLPRIGLIVSNVRGPDVPLYMAGARLVTYAPISIAIDGIGLNVTGFSYAGTMWICAVSCRDMLPDPAFFADCLRHSFEELKDAAAREPETVQAPERQAARKRKAPRSVAKRKPPAARKPAGGGSRRAQA